MVRHWREALGQTGRADRPGKHRGGFNPLACIDIAHPGGDRAPERLHRLVRPAVQDAEKDDNNKFLRIQGKEMQDCLLADMLWDADLRRTPHPARMADRLVTPEQEMPKYLENIYANSKSAMPAISPEP